MLGTEGEHIRRRAESIIDDIRKGKLFTICPMVAKRNFKQ